MKKIMIIKIRLIVKQKVKVFLQLNLIIYPNIESTSNTGLEKFLENFIMKS